MVALSVVLAGLDDVTALLDAMEDFNRLEEIPWARRDVEPALRRLLVDASLGLVGWITERDARLGYFVLTWGYDLEWNGRDAFLTELYITPDARGTGRGRAALAAVEAAAKEHGVRALHLMVRAENAPARRLYERAGFRSPPRIFLTKDLG